MPPISGLILSGGQGRRMGEADKGLQALAGRPVIARVIARFAPQVSELIISANRNVDAYARFGYRVVGDELGTGPLAGLHAGLRAARHDLVATAPCDAPALPHDLVDRLLSSLNERQADVAVAATGGLAHPVFVLVRKAALPRLTAFLEAGGRKADAWYTEAAAVTVAFDDEADAFANLNSPADFSAFARGLK